MVWLVRETCEDDKPTASVTLDSIITVSHSFLIYFCLLKMNNEAM